MSSEVELEKEEDLVGTHFKTSGKIVSGQAGAIQNNFSGDLNTVSSENPFRFNGPQRINYASNTLLNWTRFA